MSFEIIAGLVVVILGAIAGAFGIATFWRTTKQCRPIVRNIQ